MKLHENSSSGRWVVPCGRTEGHRRDEVMQMSVKKSELQNFDNRVSFWCEVYLLLNYKMLYLGVDRGYLIVTVFAHDFIIIKWRRGGGDEVPCIHNLVTRRLPSRFGHLQSFGQTLLYYWSERPQSSFARSVTKRRQATFYTQILPQRSQMILEHLYKRLL